MMFRGWRFRRSFECREAVALMNEYLDGRLDERDARRLEGHLAECPHCVEYLAQLRVTIAALGHAEPEVLSDEALSELVVVYRRWVADT